jgi:hypothetical protein
MSWNGEAVGREDFHRNGESESIGAASIAEVNDTLSAAA